MRFLLNLGQNESILSIEPSDDICRDPNFEPETSEVSDVSDCSSSEDDEEEKGGIDDCEYLLVDKLQIKKLLKFCPNCGSAVDESSIKEIKSAGSLYRITMACVKGCFYKWSSKPTSKFVRGGQGNIDITAAVTFSGNTIFNFIFFSWVFNFAL